MKTASYNILVAVLSRILDKVHFSSPRVSCDLNQEDREDRSMIYGLTPKTQRQLLYRITEEDLTVQATLRLEVTHTTVWPTDRMSLCRKNRKFCWQLTDLSTSDSGNDLSNQISVGIEEEQYGVLSDNNTK